MNNDYYYESALSASDHGDYRVAIDLYTKAIDLNPFDDQSYNNRGTCFHRIGNHRKAIADFSKAIAIRPDYSKAVHNCGIAYLQRGAPQEALNDFDKVIANDPNGEVYKNRGNAHYKLKQYTQAIQDWEKAIRYDSSLKRELKQRIIEVRDEMGESSPQDVEDVEYRMSRVYTRLNQVLKASDDGTVNLKHATIDFLQITKIADYLSDTYTKEKETITRSELAEIVKGIIKPRTSLTDKMYIEMVTILMGTIQHRIKSSSVQKRNSKKIVKMIVGLVIIILFVVLLKYC